MLISTIEKAIKERMEAFASPVLDNVAMPAICVESFPSNFDDYLNKFNHPVGTALITYAGTSYTSQHTLGLSVQGKKLDFSIVLLLRARKNKSEDVYPYLDAIEQALIGYKISGCDKITLSKSRFLDENYGVFIYQIDIQTTTKAVERPDTTDYPLLKKISNHDNFGNITEVPANA